MGRYYFKYSGSSFINMDGPYYGNYRLFYTYLLVYKLDFLARFRSPTLFFIVAAGILLTISPFF